MGHRHRTTGSDLLFKDRHHTARGAEDVAETHRHETGFTRLAGDVQALQHEFGEALRGTHDAGGVDGLVGRDREECLDAMRHGLFGQQERAEGIVFQGLGGLTLHQMNVFVCSGVKNKRRLVACEYLGDARTIQNVGHHRLDDGTHAARDQFLLDDEKRGFGLLDQDETRRVTVRDLPAELAADTAPGTGDEHDPVPHHMGYADRIELDRIAPE